MNNISDLISIKNYIINIINNNFNISNESAKKLQNIILVLDNKIINLIQSNDFLNEIGYDEKKMPEIIAQARKFNTMKRPEGK
jgi:hypothetical protein